MAPERKQWWGGQGRTLPRRASLADAGSGEAPFCPWVPLSLPSPPPPDRGERQWHGPVPTAGPCLEASVVMMAVAALPSLPGAPQLSRRADAPHGSFSYSLSRTWKWK